MLAEQPCALNPIGNPIDNKVGTKIGNPISNKQYKAQWGEETSIYILPIELPIELYWPHVGPIAMQLQSLACIVVVAVSVTSGQSNRQSNKKRNPAVQTESCAVMFFINLRTMTSSGPTLWVTFWFQKTKKINSSGPNKGVHERFGFRHIGNAQRSRKKSSNVVVSEHQEKPVVSKKGTGTSRPPHQRPWIGAGVGPLGIQSEFNRNSIGIQ